MKYNDLKISIILLFIVMITIISSFNIYAINDTDKMGRPIVDIISPTAETKLPSDTISDALRSTNGNPTQNIYSKDTVVGSNIPAYEEYVKSLYDAKMLDILEKFGEVTSIRYSVSITDVDTDRYILINDAIKDRMKMKVIVDSVGEYFAKNGFYKVDGKIYYFDEDGYMVLGPARDQRGNYYFFSYETGEMIE